jgi:hypothetical protein
MRRAARTEGFALTLVLLTFLIIELIGVGVLSITMSGLHGAVADRLAMDSVNVAEAGLNYGVAQLVSRARAATPTDASYPGEPREIPVTGPGGEAIGTFRITVTCVYPRGALPPNCADDPATGGGEGNQRHITAVGFIPAAPGRARRQIEAVVRRYDLRSGGTPLYGVCGRDAVELDQGTTVTSDVGSNGTIRLGRLTGVRQWYPLAPSAAAMAGGVSPATSGKGLVGMYSWRITFLDAAGRESSGSPPTRPIELRSEHGRLTDIPVGNPSVARRRIYRSHANAAATGPWYLVVEIPDNETREYTDPQADDALGPRVPGTISGSVVAGGEVDCAETCQNQVDGKVQFRRRGVMCPALLSPPCQPGIDRVPEVVVQDAIDQDLRWGPLDVEAGTTLSIQTLGSPRARLHMHVTDFTLQPGAMLILTGQGTVYFHVRGAIRLGAGAVIGVADENPRGRLIVPSDRIQILSCARDAAYAPAHPETASVQWDGGNRVSAILFAPDANIVINRAETLLGAVFGRDVRIVGSTASMRDPAGGMASENTAIRPSPFQYVVRWYDNPAASP